MSKKKLEKLILGFILLFALLLRLFKLNINPPSLNWDEVSHGYNAYSILKTGKDEWGFKLPLIFRAYGDYKLPLYIYLTVPLVALFGLNFYSVRLISVLSGIGLVLVSYLITKKITKDNLVARLAASLTAVSPWSLFLSRVAVEANLGAFLFATGMYFLICWLESKKQKDLIFTLLFWGLSLHAYNSARILVPFGFLFLLLKIIKEKKKRKIFLLVFLMILFLLPVIFQVKDQSGKARFDWVWLIDETAVYKIGQLRNELKLPLVVSRLLFNRPTYFIYNASKNFFANLSLKYLFFYGGTHYQFSFPYHELLYLVTAPFLILGLIYCFKVKEFWGKILFFWFFFAFIPSAITKDAPHVLRSILILPSPMILTSLGIKKITDLLKEKSLFRGNFLIFAFYFAVFVSFSRWWDQYLKIYPKNYSWAWQYGYEKVVLFLKENYPKYDKIFFTKKYGEPHEFILFWWPWDPLKYQNEPKIWDYHTNWYWVDGFDKFEFVNDWEIKNVRCQVPNNKCLMITSPENYPERWNKIKSINFLDGKSAFEILESSQQ